MKKTKNLEDVGELLKRKKPKKESVDTEGIKYPVTRGKTINIHKGLKIFRK